jgi:hypothetical protein
MPAVAMPPTAPGGRAGASVSIESSVIITNESPILSSAWMTPPSGVMNRSPTSSAPNAAP